MAGASVLAASALFAGLPISVANAQEADEDEVIVVTGTRIARRDFVANSPIATVGQDELRLSGVVSIEGLLNELPQVVPGINGTSNNPGLNGQATVDLRGLGPARTLVLVDGRRLAPSDKQGTVDLNLIPATLVENIEVMTGGASAVYGSDAVAGVVNFILRDDFEGVEFGALKGFSEEGDSEEFSYDITMGGDFADGRGHATIFAGYYNRDPLFQSERAVSQVCHPFFCSSRIPNGVLVNSGLNSFTDPDGAGPISITGGLRIDDAGDEWDPTEGSYNFNPVNLITLPAERFTFGMFATYDITDSIEVYSQTMLADSFTSVQLAPSPLASTNNITIDPAIALSYLPGAAVTAQINGRPDPNGRIVLQRRMLEWGPRQQEFDKNFLQTTLGFRGDLVEGWRWDAYYSYSQTDMYDTLSNDVSESRLQAAIDQCPVGSPAGCVSFDPFGEGSATQDVVDYTILNNVTDHHRYTQEVFNASLTGDLFELPAGPLGVAFGFEWREDDLRFEPDPASLGDLVGFNGVTPAGGSTSVSEVFAEAVVPLVADAPFAEYIGLELGARFADYSSAGTVETYKAGGEWSPFEGLRFRAMYNRATRAPSVFQLFRAGDQNFPRYTDPCRNDTGVGGGQAALNGTAVAIGSPEWNFCAGWLGLSTALVDQPATDAQLDDFWQSDAQVETLLFGNANLSVEESETITAGVVFNHDFGPGRFSAAIDYYDVEVTDPIGSPAANTVLARCVATLNLASQECINTPRLTSFQLGGIVQSLENLTGAVTTKGIDVQIGYEMDLFGGELSINSLMTFLDEFASAGTDYTGVAYGLGVTFPEFKSTVRTTYQFNDWQFSWQWEHISELDDYTYSSLYGYPYIDSIDYHDFSVRWFMTENVDLTLTCENCLDQEPQAGTIHGAAAGPNVDTSLYDIIGRYFRVGVRARF
jgi:outer membrane receptor protein involved in Fe transport